MPPCDERRSRRSRSRGTRAGGVRRSRRPGPASARRTRRSRTWRSTLVGADRPDRQAGRLQESPTMSGGNGSDERRESSPYIELDRDAWAALAAETESPLTPEEIQRLRGLGDALDLDEVQQVYLPLSRLLSLYVGAAGELHREQEAFLHRRTPPRTPFVIGLAGSVAVGKSTTARVLQQMLAHWPEHPNVALVTTDGFLYPNAELERRGLLRPQGLPGVLRPPGAAAVRGRHQVRHGRGRGADVLPPRLRRRARREGRRQAPRHRDHRGAQRAPAGAGPRGRPHRPGRQRLLRLLRLRRRRHRPHPGLVRRPLPAAARDRLPRPATPTSPSTPTSPTTRRSRRPSGSGTPSTAPTSRRTCCPPAPGPRSCCARTRTTRCATCGCGSCDRFSPPPLGQPPPANTQGPAEHPLLRA